MQCFQYDYLGRLQTAWSQGGTSCASSPTTTLEAGAAAPYWDAYTYNTEGDLTKQVSTPASGTATTYANAFPATTGADGPHAIASQTDSGGSTAKTTFSYTAAGYTSSITAGSTTDTLNWYATGYAPGQLASVASGSATVASYVYDASGSLLLQTDGSTTTLYLPDEQITATTSGTTTTTAGTRYYSLGGQTVAARTSAGTVSYLAGNQQGTDTVGISASNLAITRRYYDPYGKAIGTTPAAWPGTRGFVGGTADPATGLTNLGAREYDPATGTFISTDPVLTPDNPQDLNPYAYGFGSPETNSDPSGQHPCWDTDDDGSCEPPPPHSIPDPGGSCGCGSSPSGGPGSGGQGSGGSSGSNPGTSHKVVPPKPNFADTCPQGIVFLCWNMAFNTINQDEPADEPTPDECINPLMAVISICGTANLATSGNGEGGSGDGAPSDEGDGLPGGDNFDPGQSRHHGQDFEDSNTFTMTAGELVEFLQSTQEGRVWEQQALLEELTNEELLEAIQRPEDGDDILVTESGSQLGGHHRIDELRVRLQDGRISPDQPITLHWLAGDEYDAWGDNGGW